MYLDCSRSCDLPAESGFGHLKISHSTTAQTCFSPLSAKHISTGSIKETGRPAGGKRKHIFYLSVYIYFVYAVSASGGSQNSLYKNKAVSFRSIGPCGTSSLHGEEVSGWWVKAFCSWYLFLAS